MSMPSIDNPCAQRFRWDVRDLAPREHLMTFDGINPLLVQLLWNRGIKESDDILAFAHAAASSLHSPWSMLGIDRAVGRLLQARDNDETVVIYGDYDVDGVTSTVVLTECLRSIGVRARPFVPRRDVEGYGLHGAALERIRAEGTSLVVAVDCGISGSREIDHAREVGLDVIVADHHHVPTTVPNAVAVINPKQPNCTYPFKDLCAVGIVFKLAQALLERAGLGLNTAGQWLDLVALGTVADVVPLQGENRMLVLRGLPLLNPPRRIGIQALAQRAGVKDGRIDARAIAFILAPRLNAAGRLADAQMSVQLLMASSEDEARKLAETLDATNRERQRLTDEALEQARETILARDELPKLLLVAGEDYPAGVVGLVAARLSEEFCRPAIVAEVRGEVTRGSARSIDGFHIAEALARCADILSRHGGHARAAGFTLSTNRLDELRTRLQSFAGEQISDSDIQPRLDIDAELRLHRHDSALYQILHELEPVGFGNPPPLFLSRHLRVVDARIVGRERPGHLRLKVRAGATTWHAIGFGMGDRLSGLGDHIDAVYAIERHEWDGQAATRLRLRDLRSSVT